MNINHKYFGIFAIFLILSNPFNYKENSTQNPRKETDTIIETGFINGINYTFKKNDKSYSFYSSFYSKSEINCLKNISYDINHKIKYNNEVTSIEQIDSGINWYQAIFTIEKFIILKNESLWLIKFYSNENKIAVEMISNNSNLEIGDIIISSDGYFQFIQEENLVKVIYFQQCQVKDTYWIDYYLEHAKESAINFMLGYMQYIERNCN